MPNTRLKARARIVAYLKGQSHIRSDMLNPDYRWRLNVDEARAAKESIAFCELDSDGYFIKVGDDSRLHVPLEFCRIGTNFQDDTGRVHLLGLDFDGPNHAAGQTSEQLDRIINAMKRVEWLHIHRSRSGKGYHVFAPLGRPIFAELNDGAVMALGNRMVEIIAEEIGEPDLAEFVCKAGSIMYLSAPEAGPNGFQLIKSADTVYPGDVQPLYRAGKFNGDPAELDAEHNSLIDWLRVNAQCDVKQDGPYWKVHTTDLAHAHRQLKLRGSFTTKSTGGQDRKPNAWMVPQENGQWLVGRFGKYEDWPTHNNYSYTVLNPFLDLEDFAETIGGNIWTLEEAQQFCAQLGQTFPDPGTSPAGITVSRTKDGITFTIAVKPTQSIGDGWRKISDRKAQFRIHRPTKAADPQETLRVCYNRGGRGTMVYRRLHGSQWHQVTSDDAKMYLSSHHELTDPEIGRILTTDRPVELVNEPFQPEWLGSYRWNLDAVQLAFEPADKPGDYTHWQLILDHIGRGLDDSVRADPWCREHAIDSGAQYLKYWDARVIRAPKSRLPMLCLYSPQQNCGKSIMFSKYKLLVTGSGYTLAENALTTDFNLDLKNAIIADLDDVNLSSQAAKKLLPLLTNDSIRIVGKGRDSIQVDNSTHWGHSANRLDCFSILMGDLRTVAIQVGELTSEVPREEMDRRLLAEAPCYLRALFDLPMPPAASRLYLPVLDTPVKRRIMAANSIITDEQQAWANRLKKLADEEKLTDFTADDLVRLWPEGPNCYQLRDNWIPLSTILESDGYRTSRNSDKSGNKPAKYSIAKSEI